MADPIRYKKGYKYQLQEDYTYWTEIKKNGGGVPGYVELTEDGKLVIKKSYAWDGPSGPTFDTDSFMRASVVHDALYQLFRLGIIHPSERKTADREMRAICREDGMPRIRAWWVYTAVRWWGWRNIRKEKENPVIKAPK